MWDHILLDYSGCIVRVLLCIAVGAHTRFVVFIFFYYILGLGAYIKCLRTVPLLHNVFEISSWPNTNAFISPVW